MTLTPQIYLSFNGQCEAAFRFYEQRLGATRGGMFPYANSPMAGDVPREWEAKIMHGSITLGGLTIAGADPPPGQYERPKGFRISIEMPIQQTFWSVRFGVLTDQFGIPWTISCSQAPTEV